MNTRSQEKKHYVILQALQQCRWLALAVLGVTFPFDNSYAPAILTIVLAVAVFNGLLYLPQFRRWSEAAIAPYVIGGDFIWTILLVPFTGGIDSPYFFFLGIPLIAYAFWYTQRKTLYFALFMTLTIASLEAYANNLITTSVRHTIALLLAPITVAFLVNKLTTTQRNERTIAIKASYRAESERNRLLSLLNSIADAVIATDNHGNITHFNSATLDLLDTNTSLVGKHVNRWFHFLDDQNKEIDLLKEASKQTTAFKRDDIHMVNGIQETIRIYASVSPISAHFGHDKAEEGYIILLRDITKEKSLEEQRTEFISVTSHELRTPLAIAEANISTALLPQAGHIDDAPRKLIEQAHENIVFLGKLVGDLTTLAAAEKDLLDSNLSVLEPRTLLEELTSDYSPQAAQKGLVLKVDIADDLPAVVTSISHVREILQNFITNALKYTRQGSITIRAYANPSVSSNLILSVTDTGIGISSSDQKHLFTKFYRSEDYRTRETGGTGLGLYITTKLAQRLNAKISFESKLNQGSTFSLEIPPYSRLRRDRGKVVSAQMNNIITSI